MSSIFRLKRSAIIIAAVSVLTQSVTALAAVRIDCPTCNLYGSLDAASPVAPAAPAAVAEGMNIASILDSRGHGPALTFPGRPAADTGDTIPVFPPELTKLLTPSRGPTYTAARWDAEQGKLVGYEVAPFDPTFRTSYWDESQGALDVPSAPWFRFSQSPGQWDLCPQPLWIG